MADRVATLGVKLRPHLKTAKSLDVARLAQHGPVEGFTVSTLKEAEYFFEHGLNDLFYAVTIEPGKFQRAANLLKRGARLTVSCDHAAVARALTDAGVQLGVCFPVLIEIDSGEHRSGVAPGSSALDEIAAILQSSAGTELRGVCTHGGHSYVGRTAEDHRAVAEQECNAVVAAAERLRGKGMACPVVSVGSTPTVIYGAKPQIRS